jgi:hypothetical protein
VTHVVRDGEKISAKGICRRRWQPIQGGDQKQQKIRSAGKNIVRRWQWPASLGRHWLCSTYPQNLWITLFMKLGDQAVSRANTGLQGLFKKYLR